MDRSSVAPELHLLDEHEDENLLAYPWYIWCSLLLAECIVDLPRLGTAIRVAQTHRIDLGRGHCPHLSDAEYARWRQVWRAIIFIDTSVIPSPQPPSLLFLSYYCRWLAIGLGRKPQVYEKTTRDPFIRVCLYALR